MTYPPAGGTPDPYQPQQPYGHPQDPTSPYSQDPYATPGGGAPSSGQPYPPSSGQPYQTSYGDASKSQPYAQPYGGPAYGAPQYPPYAPVATTNTMAILALVFAFVFSPVAIVMGHVAKRQIRQTGEQGSGLATAGLWLGYIFTGLYVAFCALWIILAAAGVMTSSAGDY